MECSNRDEKFFNPRSNDPKIYPSARGIFSHFPKQSSSRFFNFRLVRIFQRANRDLSGARIFSLTSYTEREGRATEVRFIRRAMVTLSSFSFENHVQPARAASLADRPNTTLLRPFIDGGRQNAPGKPGAAIFPPSPLPVSSFPRIYH